MQPEANASREGYYVITLGDDAWEPGLIPLPEFISQLSAIE